ncbi:hypothetical protein ADUPG1_010405 [Aduncisulcus paluster]|uniref:Uncharacterized protein n=1 Tax=Aduncisulcus paluster TaxID=2918883 RepID=A0ABQ5JVW9_9EUKA|nr:hypothetical protein ADUPG1_010405 [Aduncisulcus paluster]
MDRNDVLIKRLELFCHIMNGKHSILSFTPLYVSDEDYCTYPSVYIPPSMSKMDYLSFSEHISSIFDSIEKSSGKIATYDSLWSKFGDYEKLISSKEPIEGISIPSLKDIPKKTISYSSREKHIVGLVISFKQYFNVVVRINCGVIVWFSCAPLDNQFFFLLPQEIGFPNIPPRFCAHEWLNNVTSILSRRLKTLIVSQHRIRTPLIEIECLQRVILSIAQHFSSFRAPYCDYCGSTLSSRGFSGGLSCLWIDDSISLSQSPRVTEFPHEWKKPSDFYPIGLDCIGMFHEECSKKL